MLTLLHNVLGVSRHIIHEPHLHHSNINSNLPVSASHQIRANITLHKSRIHPIVPMNTHRNNIKTRQEDKERIVYQELSDFRGTAQTQI